jgi:hypothetical protein|tara:strand:+ start:1856 stop:2176 length:321 start_codon:yes stop_codon:yes gene_type:complete
MIEWIVAKAGVETAQWAAGSVAAIGVAWILRKIPNNVIKAKFGRFMYGLGVTATLGLSKWKLTKSLWNKTLEPYIIDAIDNIIVTGVARFIEGMRSDNKVVKKKGK